MQNAPRPDRRPAKPIEGLDTTLTLFWQDLDAEQTFNADSGTSTYGRPGRRYGFDLVSGNGSNPTGGGYYILFPNGNLYAFTPDASNYLISTKAATATLVGTALYAAPALLTGATPGYTPSA